MVDVFDFDDSDEDCWSLDTPIGEKAAQCRLSQKTPSSRKVTDRSSQPAASAVPLPTSNHDAARTKNLCGRSRHARNRKKHAVQLEKKEKEYTKRDTKDQSKVDQNVQDPRMKKCDLSHKDEDNDASFTESQSSNVLRGPIPSRRKKRKKHLVANHGLLRPPMAKRAGSSYGVGITDSVSPSFGGATVNSGLSSSSISEQIQQKLQQHERQQNKLCPEPSAVVPRKVRGAGRNVFAVQDAGNHQMIHDECNELISTILVCPRGKVLAKGITVEAASELAVMLSSTKTRRILWRGAQDKKHNLTSTLSGILDVLHHTTTALSEKQSKQADARWLPLKQRLRCSKISKHASPLVIPSLEDNTVENYYSGLLLDSMVAVVSFLSWDATIGHKQSVHYKDPKGAFVLRKAILEHEGGLCAIAQLVRHADTLTSTILDAKASTISPVTTGAALESTPYTSNSSRAKYPNWPGDLPKPELDYKTSDESQEDLVGLSQLSGLSSGSKNIPVDSQSVTSASSQNTGDPTVAGRRKRRRKKGVPVLEPIAEDALSYNGMNGSLTPPRSPPRVVFRENEASNDVKTSFSFHSIDAVSPSKSPLPGRLGQNGSNSSPLEGEEASSMVSCDSALLKVHDHLGKAHAKLILPPSQEISMQHECQAHRDLRLSFGGKDPAGSACTTALRSLRRLLAGKDESDEYSCLDEVGEESCECHDTEFGEQDGKPQEDNPLLQTNVLIGSSGVIPFLAQGMAESLSALLEELDAPKPCPGCLQHLHEKLQALAPVVDNACLLHSSNRMDFCLATPLQDHQAEKKNDGNILVGSLVLFLKHWTHHKTLISDGKEKHSLTIMLDEVGLAALRTLTCLTHDNVLSAEQFATCYLENVSCSQHDNSAPCKSLPSWNCVQVVGQVLHKAAETMDSMNSAYLYDTRVLCLNTLANAVREDSNGEIRQILVAMKWPRSEKKKQSVYFLSWLTEWLVLQTHSFRASIMKGSFGKEDGKTGQNMQHSMRELDKHECDQLVTVGNGCVLLACLLQKPGASLKGKRTKTMEKVVQNIRGMILSEMPFDNGLSTGTIFLKNTLRAFSNFLYFSMGDLSVAVVGPVRELIAQLEKMEVAIVS